jgi:S-DNA-T family DNA segregation ATPase FtsK/SpoIIIE
MNGHENSPTPSDAELEAMVNTPGGEPAGEVVSLSDARRARGLDQADEDELEDDANGSVLDGDVMPAPAAPPAELTEPEPRVVEHRPGGKRRASARPVLPGWWKDPRAFAATIKWALGTVLSTLAFHLVRLPLYVLRLVWRFPVGLFRALRAVFGWVRDEANAEARNAVMAATRDSAAYLKMREDHRTRTSRRVWVALLGLLAVAGGVTAAVLMVEPTHLYLAGGALVLLLGWVGSDEVHRVVEHAGDDAEEPRLTADLITLALSKLQITAINQALREEQEAAERAMRRNHLRHESESARQARMERSRRKAIHFAALVRDGEGFRADIDLPAGATASAVCAKREEIAATMRRDIAQVWPEPDHRKHAARLVLYVNDEAMGPHNTPKWPLLAAGATNLFEPIPLGVDQRGRAVSATLMFASGLIGAVPRMGKSFTLRVLALGASLDPRCELHLYDLKGGADFRMFEKIAHSYRSGEDADDIAAIVADIKALLVEMKRRYKVIRELPEDICPEGKVTDQLASRKSLRLHPIFLGIDECQKLYEHKELGTWFAEAITDLVKRGPAVGIMAWNATQRVDASSIPRGISSNAVLRYCLKVTGHTENDMVLGTGMYHSGVNATTFSFAQDKGVGWLVGEGDAPRITRTAFIDAATAKKVVARALAAKVTAGYLTGLAAGEIEADTDTTSILDHVHAVWPKNAAGPLPKAWCAELAPLLAEHKPDLYEGWKPEQVSDALKARDVDTRQVNKIGADGQRHNWRGPTYTDITAALGITTELLSDDENKEA